MCEQTSTAFGSQRSLAVTTKVTGVPAAPVHSTTRLVEQASVGASTSLTVTVKLQLADLPQSLVTAQATELVPTANTEPEGGTHTARTLPPQQPEVVVAAKAAVAEHWPDAAVRRMLAGQTRFGNVVSSVRKGTKSMVLPNTMSPAPPGLLACLGPVAAPHQLFSMFSVSVPVKTTPVVLPEMLL